MLDPNSSTERIDLRSTDREGRIQDIVPASDFHSMEVLGSVPIWVLSGLRLVRTGSRTVVTGWEVGVYRMGLPPRRRSRLPGRVGQISPKWLRHSEPPTHFTAPPETDRSRRVDPGQFHSWHWGDSVDFSQ